MFCSTAPFSLVMQRRYNTHPWVKFDLHGHNRATMVNNVTISPGIVGTAIEGTIRLQSDFEVRYSSLFLYSSSFILISFAVGARSTHSMHLAIFRTWVIIIFMYSSIDVHLNGSISSWPRVNDHFIRCCFLPNGSRRSSQQQERQWSMVYQSYPKH